MTSSEYFYQKQITSPNAVLFAISGNFIPNSSTQLITIQQKSLSIYQIHTRLELIQQVPLFGNVTSIGVFKSTSKEHLLLSFADAKLVLLEYSEPTASFITVSIHYYEKEEFKRDALIFKPDPFIRIDPQNRVAILKFYKDKLAILPLKSEQQDEETDGLPYYPSFVIPLAQIDQKIKNIVDIVFLFDYFEPTMAILYESFPTWTGNLQEKKDTKSLVVVSLSLNAKSYPILYQVDKLPYNAMGILPVPSPTGGIVILCPNGLIHVDQACSPASVGVNSYFGYEDSWGSERNPLYKSNNQAHQESRKLGLTLESSKAVFLNPDTLLLVPKSGEMILFDLIGHEDAGRGWKRKRSGVTSIKTTPLGIRGPMASCLYRVGPWKKNAHLFWGSLVGDSHYIKFSETRLKSLVKKELIEMDELDTELYGTDNQQTIETETTSIGFKFQVIDTLVNCSPIQDMAIGEPTSYSDFTTSKDLCNLEVVTCTGQGHSGALTIVSRCIRPQILSSFDMEGIIEIWTVKCMDRNQDPSTLEYHSFLFLSKENSTIILRTGEEFEQVKESDFYTLGPCVTVGSILQDTAIVQIEPNTIFILNHEGKKLCQESVGGDEEWIVSAHLCDFYILCLVNMGHLLLYKVSEEDYSLECVFIYKDMVVSATALYKDSLACPLPLSSQGNAMDVDQDISMSLDPSPSYWCLIYSEDGSFQIVSLVDFNQVYYVPNFDYLPSLVYDCPDPSGLKPLSRPNYDLNELLLVNLGPSKDRRDLYLIVTTDQNEYVLYKLFNCIDSTHSNGNATTLANGNTSTVNGNTNPRLNMRMLRIHKKEIGRPLKTYAKGDDDKTKSLDHRPRPTFLKKLRCKYFDQIGYKGSGMYSGVFVSGRKPMWIMMAGEGAEGGKLEIIDSSKPGASYLEPSLPVMGKRYPRQHPMTADGPISSFAPLRNVNIQNGFVYVNESNQLRICQLPAQFNYDMEWPTCKVALGKSVSKICYHYSSHTYVTATSVEHPFIFSKAQRAAAVAAGVIDNESDLTADEIRNYGLPDDQREPGMYWPTSALYSLELVSPVTWETVDSIQLQESEYVMALESVNLESKETSSGRKLFVAIGTAYMRSEELPIRGRLLIYEIIDVVPEINNPQTCHKFKKVCHTDEKSPVTAIAEVNGYIVCSLGAKIIVYSIEDLELTGVAFFDINIFVTSLSTVKSLILASDIAKGVSFLAFQEEPPKLILLGKDYYPMRVHESNMLIHEDRLGFVVTDVNKNMHLMSYDPFNAHSLGGQKLLSLGQMHLGSLITKSSRLKLLSERSLKVVNPSHSCILAGADGSLSIVCPVSEKLYRRLYSLYSRMVTSLQHFAGLNPRGFRHVQALNRPLASAHSIASGPPGPKSILDGDLLSLYLNCSFSQQQELAHAVGSSVERVMDDLLEIYNRIDYF